MAKGTSQTVDPIALLKADHRKVEGLFEQFEKARGTSRKAKLAEDICMELTVHATIEEEIFYPAIKSAIEKEVHDEAYVEHDGAKVLIAEILAGNSGDPFFDAKVKVLSEAIKHHVKEEEQRSGMFAQVKGDDKVDLAALGSAMMARKTELMASIKRQGIPTPTTRSMAGAPLNRKRPVA